MCKTAYTHNPPCPHPPQHFVLLKSVNKITDLSKISRTAPLSLSSSLFLFPSLSFSLFFSLSLSFSLFLYLSLSLSLFLSVSRSSFLLPLSSLSFTTCSVFLSYCSLPHASALTLQAFKSDAPVSMLPAIQAILNVSVFQCVAVCCRVL